jgi:tetratricopeptide (TPR) repeat protein
VGVASTAKKSCIACRQLIPVSAKVCSHCHQYQLSDKPDLPKRFMAWVASASAILGLGASLFAALHWIDSHHRQTGQQKARLALAESQMQRGEYEASIRTTQTILAADPQNSRAASDQLRAAMLWVENFHVLSDDTHSASDAAAPGLDEIMSALDAGLTRSRGQSAADVLAHIGWAHWLNQRIARREDGAAAAENLQSALAIDESNVYANAMLGNILLQSGGSFHEALDHFATAVKTGNARPLVRQMQLGGLLYNETPGARAEIASVADDMRRHNEPISPDQSHRILGFAYSPAMNTQSQLAEVLSAVPSDSSWATYQWLTSAQNSDEPPGPEHDFIYAEILEVSGKNTEALEKYRQLRNQLKGSQSQSAIAIRVDEAIRRLS